MAETLVDINNLITSDPHIQGGRMILKGTGTTVGRIAVLYKQGYSAEDIVEDKSYLNLAQVYAALAYYHANQQIIDADLEDEQAEYDRLALLGTESTYLHNG